MDDEINRNILHVGFKAPFIFKPAAETRRLKELKETRDNTACDVHAAECAEGQRQVTAKAPHNNAEQRQRAAIYFSRQSMQHVS